MKINAELNLLTGYITFRDGENINVNEYTNNSL